MTSMPSVFIVGIVAVQLTFSALEYSSWSLDIMQVSLKRRNSLVSIGTKKQVSPASSSSLLPSKVSPVSSLGSHPTIPSVSDTDKSMNFMLAFCFSFFITVW